MRMIKDLKRSRVGMTGRRRRVLHSCQTTNINKVLQSLTNNTETVVSLIKSDSKMLKIYLAQTNGRASCVTTKLNRILKLHVRSKLARARIKMNFLTAKLSP